MDACDNWYALFVTTGKEEQVKGYIAQYMDDTLRAVVPKRRLKERKDGIWKEQIRTLFPGYVLVQGYIGVEEYYGIKRIPRIIKLLKSEYDPLKIEPEEMRTLSRLIGGSDMIGYSRGFIKDGKVIVTEGPLVSLEGHIVDINRRKGRAKVQISFMGEPRVVELGLTMIEPDD